MRSGGAAKVAVGGNGPHFYPSLPRTKLDSADFPRGPGRVAKGFVETGISALYSAFKDDPVSLGHSIATGGLFMHLMRIALFARGDLFPSTDIKIFSAMPDGAVATIGAMHDLGKRRIPREILHKPGRLTDGEREEMSRHAELGMEDNEIVFTRNGADLRFGVEMRYVKLIAARHHNDARGNPGDGAVVGIATLADIMDALAQDDRPYKTAKTDAQIFAILAEDISRGRLDPRLVDLVRENWDSVGKVLRMRAQARTAEMPRTLDYFDCVAERTTDKIRQMDRFDPVRLFEVAERNANLRGLAVDRLVRVWGRGR